MTITYPIDLLQDFPGWTSEFNLLWRQEQSRHASGRTRVKDFGTPLWQASYLTKNLSPNKMDYWKARLESLENGLKTFRAYPLSRCRPINHPGSANIPNGQVNSVEPNGKSLSLKGANGLSLSIGDYIRVDTTLYQLMEPAAASAGVTPVFEVRPHLSTTIVNNKTVVFLKPWVEMTLVPNSISSSVGLNGRGSISFKAIEARG